MRRVIILLGLILPFLLSNLYAQAEETTMIVQSITDVNLQEGDRFTVDISIENVTGLNAW